MLRGGSICLDSRGRAVGGESAVGGGGVLFGRAEIPTKNMRAMTRTLAADLSNATCTAQALSVLNRSVPKALAFAFRLRLRSKARHSETHVLGRMAQRRGCDLGHCVSQDSQPPLTPRHGVGLQG